jgi:hypothetical protein
MGVGLLGFVGRFKARGDGAGKVRVGGVYPGIDYRNQNLVAVGQSMRIDELEFLRSILCGIHRLLRVLRERVEVVRLRPNDNAVERVGAGTYV